jgi:hypothetical protein
MNENIEAARSNLREEVCESFLVLDASPHRCHYNSRIWTSLPLNCESGWVYFSESTPRIKARCGIAVLKGGSEVGPGVFGRNKDPEGTFSWGNLTPGADTAKGKVLYLTKSLVGPVGRYSAGFVGLPGGLVKREAGYNENEGDDFHGASALTAAANLRRAERKLS